MLEAIRKRRAVKSYQNKLLPYLAKSYGKQKHYTLGQVKTGAQNAGVDIILLCYAYAMYCTRSDFDAHHQATGEHCNYDAMRSEVLNSTSGFFGGFFSSNNFESCHHNSYDFTHHTNHDFGGHDFEGSDSGFSSD